MSIKEHDFLRRDDDVAAVRNGIQNGDKQWKQKEYPKQKSRKKEPKEALAIPDRSVTINEEVFDAQHGDEKQQGGINDQLAQSMWLPKKRIAIL